MKGRPNFFYGDISLAQGTSSIPGEANIVVRLGSRKH